MGSGNCNTKISEAGSDGNCYEFCPSGWSSVDNGPTCAQNCPAGFSASGTTNDILSCVRPTFAREIKPFLNCPPGADRQFDKCLLDCPRGSSKKFNLCIPDCPQGFLNAPGGLSCTAEFIKRSSVVREACYENETRIAGRVCLSQCPANTVPDPVNIELCYSVLPDSVRNLFWAGNGSLVSKIIFARNQIGATCPKNFTASNGQCFADCPALSGAISKECVASCPPGFQSTDNSCIRPIKTRRIVRGILGSLTFGIKEIFTILAIIFAFTKILSFIS